MELLVCLGFFPEVNAVSNNGISDTKLECTILADPKLVPAKPFETPPCFSTPVSIIDPHKIGDATSSVILV